MRKNDPRLFRNGCIAYFSPHPGDISVIKSEIIQIISRKGKSFRAGHYSGTGDSLFFVQKGICSFCCIIHINPVIPYSEFRIFICGVIELITGIRKEIRSGELCTIDRLAYLCFFTGSYICDMYAV